MTTEQSRRHGAFDARYPRQPRVVPERWTLTHPDGGEAALDWAGFAARFFPHDRRHDAEAVFAYEDYRGRIDARAPSVAGPVQPPAAG